MRRLLPLLLLAAGCSAPATRSPVQAPSDLPARAETIPGGYDVRVSGTNDATVTEFEAPVERVWQAALQAYTRLGLRLDAQDAAAHQAGGRVAARRTLNGTRLGTYFECGNEASGAIADTWRLSIESRMAVSAGHAAGSSALGTHFTVRATPIEGTSASVSPCTSRGTLEGKLAETVRQILAAQK